jgi:hypothetical protein
MPRNDLTELAQAGGLLPDDLVRQDQSAEWQKAADVPGLLKIDAGESVLLDGPLELDVPSPPASEPAATPSLPDELPEPPSVLQQPTTVRPGKASRKRRKKSAEHRPDSQRSEQSGSESNDQPDWLVTASASDEAESFGNEKLQADLSRLMEADHRGFDDEEEDSSPYALKTGDRPADDDPVPLVRIGKKSTGKSADTATWVQPAKDIAGQLWTALPRSLKRKAIFAVVGLVAFWILKLAAPSLLPGSDEYIYESLASIHAEMLAFDEGTEDPSGWNEFTQWAGEELNESRPWLEENAVPGERGRSLLLYVTRDLQEMLRLPPGSERPHLQRVNEFLEQLDEIYAADYD